MTWSNALGLALVVAAWYVIARVWIEVFRGR